MTDYNLTTVYQIWPYMIFIRHGSILMFVVHA